MNEAYIYRCFESKEELLRTAFHLEDVNFAYFLRKKLPLMHDEALSWKGEGLPALAGELALCA